MNRIRSERRTTSATPLPHCPRLCLLLLFLAPGCDLPGKPRLLDKPVPADQVVDFDGLYRQNCAGCHGADGKLGPAPPLNDAIFLSIVPDSVLLRVISEGRPGTPMPAFAAEQGRAADRRTGESAGGGHQAAVGVDSDSRMVQCRLYSVTTGSSAGDKSRGAKVFARACAPLSWAARRGRRERVTGRLEPSTTRHSWRSSAIRPCADMRSPAGRTWACPTMRTRPGARMIISR